MNQIPFFLIFTFSVCLFFTCTGINFNTYNVQTITNPTPDYASLNIFYRGGYVLNNERIPGMVGKSSSQLVKNAPRSACTISYLWLYSFGDSSLNAAKKAGNIGKISSIEYEQYAILGFVYHRFCTIITGEELVSNKKSMDTQNEK